jgi:hypothetical protein
MHKAESIIGGHGVEMNMLLYLAMAAGCQVST